MFNHKIDGISLSRALPVCIVSGCVNPSHQPDCVQTISKSCWNKLNIFMVLPRHGFCSFLVLLRCSHSSQPNAMAYIPSLLCFFVFFSYSQSLACLSCLFGASRQRAVYFIQSFISKNLSDLLHFLFHRFSTLILFSLRRKIKCRVCGKFFNIFFLSKQASNQPASCWWMSMVLFLLNESFFNSWHEISMRHRLNATKREKEKNRQRKRKRDREGKRETHRAQHETWEFNSLNNYSF